MSAGHSLKGSLICLFSVYACVLLDVLSHAINVLKYWSFGIFIDLHWLGARCFPVGSCLVTDIPPQDFKASFFYDSSTFKVRSYKEVFFSLIPLNKNWIGRKENAQAKRFCRLWFFNYLSQNLNFKNAIKLTVSNGACTETQTRNPAISYWESSSSGRGWKMTLRTVVA